MRKNILSAKEKHLKPVKTKLNHYKHKKNPWIGMAIINSNKFRNEMYKSLRLIYCDLPRYETLEKTTTITVAPSKEIQMLLKYYDKYVSNIKQTWTTINELLNKCNKKNSHHIL